MGVPCFTRIVHGEVEVVLARAIDRAVHRLAIGQGHPQRHPAPCEIAQQKSERHAITDSIGRDRTLSECLQDRSVMRFDARDRVQGNDERAGSINGLHCQPVRAHRPEVP